MTALLALTLTALSGCADDTTNDRDCNSAIRFEGTLFRSNSDMQQRVPLDEPLGTGELVGCGGLNDEAVGEVELRRIKGVAPTDAVAVTKREAEGFYLRDDLVADHDSWPKPLLP